jgi:glycine cleavage system H protein
LPEETDFLSVENCILPRGLYYDVHQHLWLRPESDDTFTIGLTDMAQTLAGKILYLTPKEIGLPRKANKPLLVYEAAKWLGVVRVPFPCTIVAHNPAVLHKAQLVNQAPYGEGWLLRIRPTEEVDILDYFVPAETAAEIYTEYLTEGIIKDCVHCLEPEEA